MFQGYLELGGVPLINTDATESYVQHLMPGAALRQTVGSRKIRVALGTEEYRTPLLDDAPWVNPLDPASHGFLGMYPITIEGLDDDTMSASVTEYMTDGGSVGSQRRGSKAIRVTALMVALDRLGLQYGRDWLSTALRSTQDAMLRYFVADPDVCASGVFGDVQDIASRAFGTLKTGYYRYRWPDTIPDLMPSRAYWDGQVTEGTAIRTGAVDADSTTEIVSSLVTQPYRRNYVANPTFRTGLAGWTLTGAGVVAWQDQGVGFARVRAVPTSALDSSGFGTGAFGTSSFGGDPPVAGLGTMPLGTGPLGGSSGGPGPVLRSAAFTMTAGVGYITVALRSADAAPTQITVYRGTTNYATTVVTPTTEWKRYTLQFTVPTDGTVGVGIGMPTASNGSLDIDNVVAEKTYPGEYFDGSTVKDGYTIGWEGVQDLSTSVWTSSDDYQIRQPDSLYRPFLEVVAGQIDNTSLNWEVRPERGLTEQLLPYERNLFDVRATSGMKVLREIDAGPAGLYAQVEFELVAGNPAPYGLPEPVSTTPLSNVVYADPIVPITLQDISWLADPNLYALSLPPKAPTILNPAVETISSWRRYYVPIPATQVADSADSVPTVAITSGDNAISQVRVRFHPNPFEWPSASVDPDSYCSEFVLSYLPAQTRMEVDGVNERAFASRGDQVQTAADHLLYGTDGGPVSWARLSCAIPYLMTVDVPLGSSIDAFDIELDLRRRH